jgi:hypothetical protein
MNYVFISPHFPPNYYQFCVHLRALGANVLGIADEPYENLCSELKNALTEYYYVPNLHNYDDLVRAMGYFTHHYGKIDGLDSHSEYWLETEARLRTDFNIDGLRLTDLPAIKRKSLMKGMFKKAGVDSAPGVVVKAAAQARRFAREHGFPLIAKPDVGVGAAKTYKFDTAEQLEVFLSPLPPVDYYLEKFIVGKIQTFDGLTDQNGDIVFSSSLVYSQGIMETVNEDADIYYYTLREIPADLQKAGQSVVRAYNIRKRFFHFEFFRIQDGSLVGLEVNMRPPGGLTTDMFNYANDINIYYEWANIILHNRFQANFTRPYHCGYVGRKWSKSYIHNHDEIMQRYPALIVHSEPISGIFSQALGDFGYLVRSPDFKQIVEVAGFIQQKTGTA